MVGTWFSRRHWRYIAWTQTKENCENWIHFIRIVTLFFNLMVKEDSLRCGEHGARNDVGESFTNLGIRYFITGEHQMLQSISPTTHPNFSSRKSDIIYWKNSLRLKCNPLKHSSNFIYLCFNVKSFITPACRIFMFRAIHRIELVVDSYCDGDAECLYEVGKESLNLIYMKLAGVPGAARDDQWRNLIAFFL
jgi:hypothetical protein